MDSNSSSDKSPKSMAALVWGAIVALGVVVGLFAGIKDLVHWPLAPSPADKAAWHIVAFGTHQACDQLKSIRDGYYADRADQLRSHPDRRLITVHQVVSEATDVKAAPYSPDRSAAQKAAFELFQSAVRDQCQAIAAAQVPAGLVKAVDFGQVPPAPQCSDEIDGCYYDGEKATCVIEKTEEVCGTAADADTKLFGLKIF